MESAPQQKEQPHNVHVLLQKEHCAVFRLRPRVGRACGCGRSHSWVMSKSLASPPPHPHFRNWSCRPPTPAGFLPSPCQPRSPPGFASLPSSCLAVFAQGLNPAYATNSTYFCLLGWGQALGLGREWIHEEQLLCRTCPIKMQGSDILGKPREFGRMLRKVVLQFIHFGWNY